MRHTLASVFVAAAIISTYGCASRTSHQVHTATATFDARAVIREVRETEARYDAAAARGNYEAMAEFVTPDFVYIDISGNRMTPQLVLSRRQEDHRMVVSDDVLDEEFIALSNSVVIVRSHNAGLSHYYGGLPRRSESRSTVVWCKGDDNQWRMASAQANVVMRPAYPVKVRIDLPPDRVAVFAGKFRLLHEPGLTFILRAVDDSLHAEIPGEFSAMAFYAEGDREFFATARPFALRFDDDANGFTLITWGEETRGVRVDR